MEASTPAQFDRVLAITDQPNDARAILDFLSGADEGSFDVEWVRTLSDGMNRLQRQPIAAIILDLALADSDGIETFDRLSKCAPRVPILVFTGPKDEDTAKKAVQRGAQDFLPKSLLSSYSLPRAVRRVIALKTASEALLGDRERAEVTLNSIGDAVLSTDVEGKITYLNTVAERMTGWRRENALGKKLDEVFQVINKVTRQPARNPLEFAIQQDRAVGLMTNSVLVRRDGFESAIEDSAAPIRDHEGRLVGAVIVFRDVGEAQALARKMAQVAQHDPLTELPNRLLLNDRLTQAIAMATRHRTKLAVLFIDLDNFKPVNDSLGHLTGDAVLQSVAKRLRQTLRDTDTVDRQGGDEFVILLPEVESPGSAALVARKLVAALAAPHLADGRELRVTASIGISIYPGHGHDAESLVHKADIAMYAAKKSGGGNYHFA